MDAIKLLNRLDSREISERLEKLSAERLALMSLLRAARARDRRQSPEKQKGGGNV